MLIPFALKKLLILFQYPRLSPKVTGEYQVGTLKTRIPNSVACQIHYPIEDAAFAAADRRRYEPYFRQNAVGGLTDYVGSSEGMLDFLSARKAPVPSGLEVLSSSSNDNGAEPHTSFPIVLFSHGLGGCMEMYSELCRDLASHGYVVFALEHEDGSGCYAETHDGRRILYKRPDDTSYSREKVLRFRGPMLDQRVGEIERVMEFLANDKRASILDGDESILLRNVLTKTNTKNGFALVGHSFGAATLAQLLVRSSLPASVKISSASFLDPWCFSLPDSILKNGVKSVPLLTILSESWTKNKELPQVLEFLRSSSTENAINDGENDVQSPSVWWLPNTVHQSFADSANWLPTFVAHRMYMRGRNEQRHDTSSIVARMCASHIEQRHDIDLFNEYSDLLKPYALELSRLPHVLT